MRSRRTRHEVPSAVVLAARPFFRYSYSRDAYVLRGVGSRVGPVLRPRRRRFARQDDELLPVPAGLFTREGAQPRPAFGPVTPESIIEPLRQRSDGGKSQGKG